MARTIGIDLGTTNSVMATIEGGEPTMIAPGIALGYRGTAPLRVRRLAAHAAPIPSAIDLERTVLPSQDDIYEACLELFDA